MRVAPSTQEYVSHARRSSSNFEQKATAPLAAIVMAGILYTYAVTSIRAAKRNAQLHREADGGQVDMRKESLRRHGVLDKVEGTKGFELFRDSRAEDKLESENTGANKAAPLGSIPQDEGPASRTEVETGLQNYKGIGNAVKRFKEEKPE